MAERRALLEGLKPAAPPVDPKHEEAFVYGSKKAAQPPESAARPAADLAPVVRNKQARVQLSTKMRADYAEALKRASLERQLRGEEPNKLQDILEQALEPWLRQNGYLQ